MIKTELNYFFAALMFYTRIPCPSWFQHRDEYLGKSRKYFPLMGWIVGALGVVTFWITQFILPTSLALILSMAATILATGAFHEDGFTDVCDGFGGGWTRDQIMTIMKDSRIGTYGTVGIVLLLSIKFFTLYEIQNVSNSLLLVTLFSGHAVSRFIASMFVQSHEYVQDPDKSKIRPIATLRLTPAENLYSSLFAVIPLLFFLPHWLLIFAIVPAYLAKIYLGVYFKRRIGGYTGDCLGAVQQVSEVVFALSILALCRFT